MVSYADVEKLLASQHDEPRVLSLYLEVPLEQQELRVLPARASDLITAASGAARGPDAERVLAHARQEVRHFLDSGARTWAGHCAGIFVCGPESLAETIKLPAGTGERAVLATRPHVRPLLAALQRHPAHWVVVVNRRHAWLFSVSGDQVKLVAQPTGPGLPTASYGGWYGLESYATNERIAGLAHQHFEDTAEMLGRAIRRAPGEMFVVGGHVATIPQFLATLGHDERKLFAGSFAVDTATMTPGKIRALADPVIRTWVDRTERTVVDQIRRQPAGGLAAVGMPQCLAAVRRHSIRALAVPGQALVPGYACRACGALGMTRAELKAFGSGCAHGDSQAIAVPDLVEEIAVATIADGGLVEAVAAPPDGIAALLRFPLVPRG